MGIGPVPVHIVRCVVLAGIGALLVVEVCPRWSLQEQALRHLRELPHAWLMLAMTFVVAAAAFVFAAATGRVMTVPVTECNRLAINPPESATITTYLVPVVVSIRSLENRAIQGIGMP